MTRTRVIPRRKRVRLSSRNRGDSRRGNSFPWLIGWLALALILLGIGVQQNLGADPKTDRVTEAVEIISGDNLTAASSEAEGSPDSGESETTSTQAWFATTIRRPSGPPMIELDQADPQGRVGKIACSTCHSVRDPDLTNRKPEDLTDFHQNMPMAHGELACYSCHSPTNADALHLADGTSVSYPDVMTLCAQCHGTQARDYAHGAHGGMNGYWDLTRGPRQRNNCIDCHDPHVPKFPSMQPTFKPRDRFLEPPQNHTAPVHDQFSSKEHPDE